MPMSKKIAICPGSFDPVTVGHLDIVTRAAKLFDEVVVVVMNNSAKNPLFTADERVAMLKKVTSLMENVSVEKSDGLLADYAKEKNATAVVKGLRAVSDFEYEFQMALTNKKLNPDLDTIFLTTSAENMYLSSSLVRQVGAMGGDISEFVPAEIKEEILERLCK
ncbi:MAG: pantetheine-phosphate adenylyltransferase [Clostridia bacterium]|nr:pantetheine-phosphate adenylyltransferase [Clostridia bacterium]